MSIDIYYKESNLDPSKNTRITQITESNILKSSVYTKPFSTVDSLFNFSIHDVVVVIKAGAIYNKKIKDRLSNSLSQIKLKQHIHFFIEDLFAVDIDPLEIKFINDLVKILDIKHTIYHCEKNNFTKYFDWFVCDSVLSISNSPIITTNFSKKICCLNRRYTDYRYLASAFLSNYKNSVHLSQYYSLDQVEQCRIDIDSLSENLKIKTGIGILRGQGKERDYTSPVNVDYISEENVKELIKITQNSYCSLVTESKFHSTMPNFSEKTLRAIIAGRPFVLLAPPGTLQLLRDLGFKTFSKYWDESYDLETDSTKRFEKVMFVVKDILEKENLDIEPMLSVLKHNQEQLKSIPRRMYQLLDQRP